jgi:peptidoglycan hydrolase-like protein with peptidoglycan-binding domain
MRTKRMLATLAASGLFAVLTTMMAASPAAALPTCNSHRIYQEANVPSVASSGSVNCEYTLNYCYGENLRQDGIFGSGTRAALIWAQREAGTAADGVYGPNTRRAILHRAIGPIFGCKHVS